MPSDDSLRFYTELCLRRGYLDLAEAAERLRQEAYLRFFQKRSRAQKWLSYCPNGRFSLPEGTEDELRRSLTEFLLLSLDERQLQPKGYMSYRLRPLSRLLQRIRPGSQAEFCAALREPPSPFSPPDRACASAFLLYLDGQGKTNSYDRDVWHFSDYPIAEERKNPTRMLRTVSFSAIQNEENKRLVKDYVDFRLRFSDNTVNHIAATASALAKLLNTNPKPYTLWTEEDGAAFAAWLQSAYSNRASRISRMAALESFTAFLIDNGIRKDSPIRAWHALGQRGGAYEYKATAPDRAVVNQIFAVLGALPEPLVLYFLLIYTTGMRSSEAAAMRRDCLEKRPQACFLRFHSIKMKKPVTNVIPPALYERIDAYRKMLPPETPLLFPTPKDPNRPRQCSSLSASLQKALAPYGIRNADGSDYQFRAHEFRHRMGVRMRELSIPFPFIQEQLHHASPEMTLAYVEYLDRQKLVKMRKYFDCHGREVSPSSEIALGDEKAYAEFLRSHLNEQLLPNGHCGRPVRLGACPHGNVCLTCPSFRTDASFLPVHRRELQEAEHRQAEAEKRGDRRQADRLASLCASLEAIISALEEEP